MDGSRFDEMTRSLANASRRSLLKAGLGSALGLMISGIGRDGALAAQVKRGAGEVCRKPSECASGFCGQRDRTGRGRCSCQSNGDCPQTITNIACGSVSCIAGACVTQVNSGAECDDGNLCTTNDLCQPDGTCIGSAVECTPSSQCYEIVGCDSATGQCVETAKPDGTPCEFSDPNATGETCQAGSCVCTPTGTDCGTKECGPGMTTCGQVISCGECGQDEYCLDGACLIES